MGGGGTGSPDPPPWPTNGPPEAVAPGGATGLVQPWAPGEGGVPAPGIEVTVGWSCTEGDQLPASGPAPALPRGTPAWGAASCGPGPGAPATGARCSGGAHGFGSPPPGVPGGCAASDIRGVPSLERPVMLRPDHGP